MLVMHFERKKGTGHLYLLQDKLQAPDVIFVTQGYGGLQNAADDPVMQIVCFLRKVARWSIPELWQITPALEAMSEAVSLIGKVKQGLMRLLYFSGTA